MNIIDEIIVDAMLFTVLFFLFFILLMVIAEITKKAGRDIINRERREKKAINKISRMKEMT